MGQNLKSNFGKRDWLESQVHDDGTTAGGCRLYTFFCLFVCTPVMNRENRVFFRVFVFVHLHTKSRYVLVCTHQFNLTKATTVVTPMGAQGHPSSLFSKRAPPRG